MEDYRHSYAENCLMHCGHTAFPQGRPCLKAFKSSTETSPGKCVESGELYKNSTTEDEVL
jgi:hypothetical protein